MKVPSNEPYVEYAIENYLSETTKPCRRQLDLASKHAETNGFIPAKESYLVLGISINFASFCTVSYQFFEPCSTKLVFCDSLNVTPAVLPLSLRPHCRSCSRWLAWSRPQWSTANTELERARRDWEFVAIVAANIYAAHLCDGLGWLYCTNRKG